MEQQQSQNKISVLKIELNTRCVTLGGSSQSEASELLGTVSGNVLVVLFPFPFFFLFSFAARFSHCLSVITIVSSSSCFTLTGLDSGLPDIGVPFDDCEAVTAVAVLMGCMVGNWKCSNWPLWTALRVILFS